MQRNLGKNQNQGVAMNSKKPDNIIDLKRDAAFKLYFKGDEKVLISLLQRFLPLPQGSKVVSAEVIDSETNTPTLSPKEKTFVLDLKAKIRRKEGRKLLAAEMVNVEMQSGSQTNFTNRLLAYASRLYTSQIEEGIDYKNIYPVYSLAFCSDNLKEFASIADEYYHLCTLRREDNNPSRQPLFSRGMQFVVVELKKFPKRTVKELVDLREHWCYILKEAPHISEGEFKAIKKKGKEMGNAVKRLWNLSEDDYIREQIEAREKQRMDQLAREDYAREEGREEGREEEREEVALHMLAEGENIAKICKYTGLTEKEVKTLWAEQK